MNIVTATITSDMRDAANRIDAYLLVAGWARRRYTTRAGHCPTSVGGQPTRYSKIEDMAAVIYLRCNVLFPAIDLRDAPVGFDPQVSA